MKVVIYGLAVVTLCLVVMTLILFAQVQTLKGHCSYQSETMRSIADSFRQNRLDYELYWYCPGEFHAIVGSHATVTYRGGE